MNSAENPPAQVDVIVIGAGPAGTTAAAKLAQSGRSVLVLERRSLPRFHIGESLLPPITAILEELGAYDRVLEQGYVLKHGAEFSGGRKGRFGRIPFAGQGPGRHHVTFQVERAHFDKTMADVAQESGAAVLQEATVHELLRDGDRVVGVRYEHGGRTHTAHASYVIDAGGRASKVAHTFGLRRSIDSLRMVAAYQHFKGLDEKYNPGVEGDLQIGGHAEGWVWAIPIWPDTVSVGAVMPRELLHGVADREAVFRDHVSRISRITERLTGTEPVGELKVETDYCYYSDTITGDGWFMAGDSACFFDPIFSGGVFLAMATGLRAAQSVDTILGEPERTANVQLAYSDFYKTGYDVYGRLIHAYYEAGYSLRGFLQSAGLDISGDQLGTNKWVARLVSGDFWNSRNILLRHLRDQPRWNTFAPFEPHWGCPFYEDLNVAEDEAEQAATEPGARSVTVA
ncbi:NAD(P)/FAD-dependent oxidoreductase [Streptomyces sp. NPDC007094]|uniref:NAD(P)/FAD-dependent oxidoreductase n=1 Tax=Streptomyces sp. NPDC007094 TaxID=3155359 RepID=UPI0034033C63